MPSQITPCLWFDGQAEEAASFYTSFFKDGKIIHTQHYGEAGKEAHGHDAGTVMIVEFELNGQTFTALNGGPQFKFNEAISFRIECEDQKELDHYWEKLSDGGDPAKQQCGWVGDRFGVSWQVVPKVLNRMISDPDVAKSQRTVTALMGMKKIDIAGLKAAYEG
jgi:predicted 3-demethylubiquinone-9 3-methyltransferase (glyoxalase superfamily)